MTDSVVLAWSALARDLLADGQWHDGMTVVREMERVIPPGIALRAAEAVRESRATQRNGEPGERVIYRPEATLIALGKRKITQRLVHARVHKGAWTVSQWPLPAGAWHTGGWQLRDIRVGWMTINALARRYRVAHETAVRLIGMEPPLECWQPGSRVRRVREAEFAIRLGENIRLPDSEPPPDEVVVEPPPTPRPSRGHMSVANLMRRSRVSRPVAALIVAATPHLQWEHGKTKTFLPDIELPRWDALVDEHLRITGSGRVSFVDPELQEIYRRRRAGQASLDEVLPHMRRVFHDPNAQEAPDDHLDDVDDLRPTPGLP